MLNWIIKWILERARNLLSRLGGQVAGRKIRNDARLATFRNRMETARAIAKRNPQGLLSYVRALGRRVQADELVEVCGEVPHGRGPEANFSKLFFPNMVGLSPSRESVLDVARPIKAEQYKLQLGRDLLIPSPWEQDRIVNAFCDIGFGKLEGAWEEDYHHTVMLILPIGIGIINEGNHSIAAGIVNGEGAVTNSWTMDITPVYDLVKFDGLVYRRICDDSVIADSACPDMGAIFEIGRMMVQHRVKFDAPTASEEELRDKTWSGPLNQRRYAVTRDGVAEFYDTLESDIIALMLAAGIERDSARWERILYCQETLEDTRSGENVQWQFERLTEKPLYRRLH